MVLRIFPIPSTYPLPPSPSLPLSLSLPSLRIFLHRWKPCIDRCNWPLLHRAVSDAYPGWMDSLNMKTTLFIRWQGDNNKNGGDINHRVCTVYVHWTAPVHHCRIELRSHRAPGIYQTQTRFDQRSQSCLYRARKPVRCPDRTTEYRFGLITIDFKLCFEIKPPPSPAKTIRFNPIIISSLFPIPNNL